MKLTRVLDTGRMKGLQRTACTWTSFFCLFVKAEKLGIGRSNSKPVSPILVIPKC